MNTVERYDLGHLPYRPVWDLQAAVQDRLIREKRVRREDPRGDGPRSNDLLLFVEHPHVYTLGKSGDRTNLLKGLAELSDIEAEFIETDRGGDITYHGPGQVVGYPILDLDRHMTDVHRYLRRLEEVIIRTCGDYGIRGDRIDGLTGVWVGQEKVCALGIRCSRWVTMHGFALNVSTDLSYFSHIVPCGITDKKVTSLEKLLDRPVPPEEVKNRIAAHFETVFEVELRTVETLPELEGQFSYLKHSSVSSTPN